MSLKLQEMKTKRDYLLLATLVLFSYRGEAQQPPSSEVYNYNTFEAQKKWIVGTFLNDDHNWEFEFTRDGRCHERFLITDDAPNEYTYTIRYSTRKAETPSGYVNESVYTLYLKAIPTNPDEDLTYEMGVSDTGLALYPWGHGGQFVFSRVKTW